MLDELLKVIRAIRWLLLERTFQSPHKQTAKSILDEMNKQGGTVLSIHSAIEAGM